METSSSTMYWVIGGIVIASAIIAVVLFAFPTITDGIVDFMNSMLGHAQSRVEDTYGKGSAQTPATPAKPGTK